MARTTTSSSALVQRVAWSPTALPTLKVRGSGGQAPTGPGKGYVATRTDTAAKTNAKIIETPQSISVVTKAK